MNTQVEINKIGTTTLATAGKYCDRNVDVNVTVHDTDDLLQGTLEGEYVSDKVTKLQYAAFYGCNKLTKISLPNCTETVSGYTFNGCSGVKEIDLPKLTTIGDAARVFYNMQGVKEISLPELTTAPNLNSTFSNCRNVKRINLPKLGATTVQTRAFDNCYYLETIILGGDFKTLANTDAFRYTAQLSGDFSVYVPDALVDTYKTATNWSAFADKIKPMSELEG